MRSETQGPERGRPESYFGQPQRQHLVTHARRRLVNPVESAINFVDACAVARYPGGGGIHTLDPDKPTAVAAGVGYRMPASPPSVARRIILAPRRDGSARSEKSNAKARDGTGPNAEQAMIFRSSWKGLAMFCDRPASLLTMKPFSVPSAEQRKCPFGSRPGRSRRELLGAGTATFA